MAFDFEKLGGNIIITINAEGGYETFEDMREKIIRMDESIIPAMRASTPPTVINIFLGGINYPILNGLKKLKDGLGFEDLLPQEAKDQYKEAIDQERLNAEKIDSDARAALEHARKTGNWSNVPDAVKGDVISGIILTTSMFVAGREITQELDIVTYECAYGMNIFRDLFAAVRDVVGGRSKAVEKVLRDARVVAMHGLREEALNVGADAVIAIDLDYSEISGGGKSGMLVVIASGTAVTLKSVSN